MKFPVNPRSHGASNPENLEHLPDWMDVEVVERGDVFYLSEVIVNRAATFELLDELWELQEDSAISLRNSDRLIAGENLVMSKHLYLIYRTAFLGISEALAEASYELSGKRFRLCDGGHTLEYTGGKRALYSLSDTPADKTCLDKWIDGSYQTIHFIANTLKRMAEQSLVEDYPGATKKRQASKVIRTLNQWVYNHLEPSEHSAEVWEVRSKSTGSGVHKMPVSPRWMLDQVPKMKRRFPWITEELVVAVYPFLTGDFYDGIVGEEAFNMIHPFLYSPHFLTGE